MTVRYGIFEMPESVEVEGETPKGDTVRLIAEPLERGFGHTLGNALRRTMLTSLEAPSIIAMRIEGVPHEFMAVEGIVEDMTDIVLNFKSALLRCEDPEFKMRAGGHLINSKLEITQEDLDKAEGQIDVTLGGLIKDETFSVVDPKHHLFSVTKPMSRLVQMRVGVGRGYVPSERIEIEDRHDEEIIIDAIYTPVRLVRYAVENTRVGQDTDYDRLVLEVTTDGRIRARDAVSYASQILGNHLQVFSAVIESEVSYYSPEEGGDKKEDELLAQLVLNINDIELSVRSANCIQGAGIHTIAELVLRTSQELLKCRNFGRKSLEEIKDKLMEMGLYLGMDLSKFGLHKDDQDLPQKIEQLRQYLLEKQAETTV